MLAFRSDRVFEAAGLIGHAALLFVLIIRQRARRFPILTLLMGYHVFEAIFLFCLSKVGSPRQQYFGFWWIMAFGYVVEIAFILELSFGIMRVTGIPTRQALKPFLLWSTLGAILAAPVSHALTAGKVNGWDLWDMRATYFATCLTCFLYLAMLKTVNLWHLPWRSHILTLGEGFALWQFVSTLMDTLHVWSGWRWGDKGFDYTSKAVYLAVLLFWIVRLWFPERELDKKMSPDSEDLLRALARKADTVGTSP